MGFQGLAGFGGGATGLSRISILDADPGWDSSPVVANSLRFNNDGAGWPAPSGDSAYLSKVFGTPTNTKIWTFSTWFKKSINGDYCALFNGVWVGSQGRYGYITIDSNDQLTVFLGQYPNGNPDYIYFTSSQKLRDTSAWYHICVAVDTTQATESDRFSAYINGVEVTSWDIETYPDQNEVYHINNNHSSGHMIGAIKNTVNTGHSRWGNGYQAQTIFIDGQKKAASDFGLTDATAEQWVPKAYTGTYGNNGLYLKYDNTSDLGEDSSGNDNDFTANNFQAVAGNISLSDVSLTVPSSGWLSGRDLEDYVFDGDMESYLLSNTGGDNYSVNFSPGIAVSSSIEIFGRTGSQSVSSNLSSSVVYTSAQWTTIYSGSGTLTQITMIANANRPALCGIKVDGVELLDAAALPDAGIDVLADSPSTYDDSGNGVGNYATLNPLQNAAGNTFSNGNLQLNTNGSGWGPATSTIAMKTGKWYFEVECITAPLATSFVGIVAADSDFTANTSLGHYPVCTAYQGDGLKYTGGGGSGASSYGATWGAGDTIGIAFDADNNTVTFYKNGTSQGAITSVPDDEYYFGVDAYHNAASYVFHANFGQRAFAYTNAGVDRPAADFLTLNTFNLDATTILSGTYEGNGDADGPVVWMNGTPATLKIGTSDPPTSLVTFSPTTVDPLSNGFKIRHASTNNVDGTTYYWLATIDKAFKYSNAQ